MGPKIIKLLSDYGMLIVLILLCIFYSVSTFRPQNPSPSQAAADLVESSKLSAFENQQILIAGRDHPDDHRLTEILQEKLSSLPGISIESVNGSPQELRRKLDSMKGANAPDHVLSSIEYESIVKNMTSSLGNTKIHAPRKYNWPTFLLADNIRNVANQIVVIALIAVGMTMVIITAGIDLSVGSLIALSAVVAAWLIGQWGGVGAGTGVLWAASLVAILVGGLVGLFSGLTITKFKVPPFIATLAMMLVASGFAYIISGGESIYDIPDSYVWLGRGADLLSIPNAVILMVLVYAAAYILMTHTKLGRHIYAVGGNPEAARLAGIRVDRVLLFVYVICGLLAGLGGVIQASQLKSGAPTYGLLYELYVIAAVVVGGTSLAGGQGKILGTLIGAFIIAVIQNGMNLTGVESYTQKVVLGLVILGAVLLDMLKRKDWWQRKMAKG